MEQPSIPLYDKDLGAGERARSPGAGEDGPGAGGGQQGARLREDAHERQEGQRGGGGRWITSLVDNDWVGHWLIMMGQVTG